MAETQHPDIPHCIVCGYPDFRPFPDGISLFDICPCCGCQSGYAYSSPDENAHLLALRTDWFYDLPGNWWGPVDRKPEGWTAIDQLKAAEIPTPTPRNLQSEQAKL